MKTATDEKKLGVYIMTLLAIVILVAWTVTWFNQVMKNSMKAEFLKDSNAKFDAITIGLRYKFDTLYADINTFAELPILKNELSGITRYVDHKTEVEMKPSMAEGQEKELYQIFEQYGQYHEQTAYVYLGTEYGGYIAWPETQITAYYDPRLRPWYQLGIAGDGNIRQTEPYIDLVTKRMIISNVRAIYNGENIIQGVFGIDINVALTDIEDILNGTKSSEEQHFLIVHRGGLILADNRFPQHNMKQLSDSYPELGGNYIPGQVYELDIMGKRYFLTLKNIEESGWKLYAMVPEKASDFMVKNNFLKYLIGVIVLALFVFAIFLSVVYLYFYNKKLGEMVKGKTLDLEEAIQQLSEKESLVKASETRYIALVNNVPGVVFRCEPFAPWVMLNISDGVYELTGYKPKEFIKGSHTMVWNSLIIEEDRMKVNFANESENNGIYEIEYRIIDSQNNRKWVFERGRRVVYENGDSYIEGIIFDITDRKQNKL